METWQKLIEQAGVLQLSWQNLVMVLVGGILSFLRSERILNRSY
jgi:hypothetical protein